MISLVQGTQPVSPFLGAWLSRGTSGLSFCLPRPPPPWTVTLGTGPGCLGLAWPVPLEVTLSGSLQAPGLCLAGS